MLETDPEIKKNRFDFGDRSEKNVGNCLGISQQSRNKGPKGLKENPLLALQHCNISSISSISSNSRIAALNSSLIA